MTQKEASQLNAKMMEVKAAWIKACAAAGVPADSKFVVFDQSIPESIEHNRLMGEFFALRKRLGCHVFGRRATRGGVYYE